jgi:putative oxidoreductase
MVATTVIRKKATDASPYMLALFRIIVGLLFACHGAAGMFGLFGRASGSSPAFGEWPGWWAALIQLAGGILVLLGVGTRTAAIICSGSMAYAYFTVHFSHGLLPIQNGGEPAAMFCWSFLLIATLGPGAWALRGVMASRRVAERIQPAPVA